MIMKTIYVIVSIVGFSFTMWAQNAQIAEADKKYNKYSYVDAIEIYEKVAEKGYESPELFQKLGNAYYFNSNLLTAAKWYGKLFELNPEQEPEYYFRYAQALKASEEYEKSDAYMAKFYEKSPDSRAKLYAENKDYLKDIEVNSGKYTVAPTDINSEYSDFGPAFFGDKIVYSSSRKEGALYKKINPWTEQNYRDLYVVEKDNNYKLSNPINFSNVINTKYNESTPVFTKDGKTIYFTRNNFNSGRKGKADDKSTLIKIYKANLVDGVWTNVKELPFCSDDYSTAHPALSFDEKTLYFVSDMPGGFGSSDLYKVSIDANGNFGKPENLGKNINTESKETFPFLDDDNNLYFASDGYPGLGGLDIYKAKITASGYERPSNMGKPINSPLDDFCIIMDKEHKGYLSSNRVGSVGYDDIYSFTKCNYTVEGFITDLKTGEILTDATVEIFDENSKKVNETKSNALGKYSLAIECRESYTVRASKKDYESAEKMFVSENADNISKVNLALDRNVFLVETGTDLAKVFDISLIYFDLDKWNIRPDAAKDLEKIIAVMKQNPDMKVDIRSHTDSRQTHKYNQTLSDRRAKATMDFMIKNGIDKSRLTAKGYGETELVNECKDNVPCSEAQHQKNRRSEFIILKM